MLDKDVVSVHVSGPARYPVSDSIRYFHAEVHAWESGAGYRETEMEPDNVSTWEDGSDFTKPPMVSYTKFSWEWVEATVFPHEGAMADEMSVVTKGTTMAYYSP